MLSCCPNSCRSPAMSCWTQSNMYVTLLRLFARNLLEPSPPPPLSSFSPLLLSFFPQPFVSDRVHRTCITATSSRLLSLPPLCLFTSIGSRSSSSATIDREVHSNPVHPNVARRNAFPLQGLLYCIAHDKGAIHGQSTAIHSASCNVVHFARDVAKW